MINPHTFYQPEGLDFLDWAGYNILMRVVLKSLDKYILRLDPKEEFIERLKNFAEKKRIQAGTFYALGSTEELILSWYNMDKKKYEDKTFREKLEVISILGNIARMGKEIVVHAHGSFSDRNMKMIAGHIKKMVISATCEIVFTKLDGELKRKFDKKTGLNLLQ